MLLKVSHINRGSVSLIDPECPAGEHPWRVTLHDVRENLELGDTIEITILADGVLGSRYTKIVRHLFKQGKLYVEKEPMNFSVFTEDNHVASIAFEGVCNSLMQGSIINLSWRKV